MSMVKVVITTKDEVDSSNDESKWTEKDWEEKFPPEKNKKEDAGEE